MPGNKHELKPSTISGYRSMTTATGEGRLTRLLRTRVQLPRATSASCLSSTVHCSAMSQGLLAGPAPPPMTCRHISAAGAHGSPASESASAPDLCGSPLRGQGPIGWPAVATRGPFLLWPPPPPPGHADPRRFWHQIDQSPTGHAGGVRSGLCPVL